MVVTMDAPDRTRLAPRLVLVLAVLACLFGWGNAVASAAGDRELAPRHAAHAASAGTLDLPIDAPAHGDDEGGHSPGHHHDALTCMAGSVAAALGTPALSDAAALVIPAAPTLAAARDDAVAAAPHRGPSVTSLCVLRT